MRSRRPHPLPAAVLTATVVIAWAGAGAPAHAGPDPVGTWPLRPQPDVVERFDPPDSTWGAGHRGVDLAGSPGQRVRAALPGTVTFTAAIAGRPVVVVDHGATRTTYEPVVGLRSPGARVDAGEVIGTLAIPGSHCFPMACLHWGWLRGETYLDPLGLVGGGPVRLMPLGGLPNGPATPTLLPRPTPYAGWVPLARLLGDRR